MADNWWEAAPLLEEEEEERWWEAAPLVGTEAQAPAESGRFGIPGRAGSLPDQPPEPEPDFMMAPLEGIAPREGTKPWFRIEPEAQTPNKFKLHDTAEEVPTPERIVEEELAGPPESTEELAGPPHLDADWESMGAVDKFALSVERGTRRFANAVYRMPRALSAISRRQKMESIIGLFDLGAPDEVLREMAVEFSRVREGGAQGGAELNRYRSLIKDLKRAKAGFPGVREDVDERLESARKDEVAKLKAYLEEKGVLDKLPTDMGLAEAMREGQSLSESIGSIWGVISEDWTRLANILGESAPHVAGGIIGSAIGGPFGVAIGTAMTDIAQRFEGELATMMEIRGLDPSNPDHLAEMVNDRDAFNMARRRALRGSVSIGAASGLGVGIASTGASAVRRGLAGAVVGPPAGAVGELGAQVAGTGPVNWPDVVIEAVAEGPSAAVEAAVAGRNAARVDRSRAETQELVKDVLDPGKPLDEVVEDIADPETTPIVDDLPPAPAGTPTTIEFTDEMLAEVNRDMVMGAAEGGYEATLPSELEDTENAADTTGTDRGSTEPDSDIEQPDTAGRVRATGQIQEVLERPATSESVTGWGADAEADTAGTGSKADTTGVRAAGRSTADAAEPAAGVRPSQTGLQTSKGVGAKDTSGVETALDRRKTSIPGRGAATAAGSGVGPAVAVGDTGTTSDADSPPGRSAAADGGEFPAPATGPDAAAAVAVVPTGDESAGAAADVDAPAVQPAARIAIPGRRADAGGTAVHPAADGDVTPDGPGVTEAPDAQAVGEQAANVAKQAEGVRRGSGRLARRTVNKKAPPAGTKPDYDKNNLARTRSTPELEARYARSLLNLVGGNEIKLTMADVNDISEDARTNAEAWPGQLVSAIDEGGVRGFGALVRPGEAVIGTSRSVPKEARPITIAHEVGHVIKGEMFEKAGEKTRNAVEAAYRKDRDALVEKSTSGEDVFKAARPPGILAGISTKGGNKDLLTAQEYARSQEGEYVLSFDEWFADGVAKWAMTSETPKNLVDNFFTAVAAKIKQLYSAATGKRRLPAKELRKYLDGLVENARALADAERKARASESRRKGAATRRRVDPKKDDIMTAIAKRGGLEWAESETEGVDPKWFGHKFADNTLYAFTKKGMSWDYMREALDELGYPVGLDKNKLVDLVGRALGGEKIHSIAAGDRMAQEAVEAQEQLDLFGEEIGTATREELMQDPNYDPEIGFLRAGTDPVIQRIYNALDPKSQKLFDDSVAKFSGQSGITEVEANRLIAEHGKKIDGRVRRGELPKGEGATLKAAFAKKTKAQVTKSLVQMEGERLKKKNRNTNIVKVREKEMTSDEAKAANAAFEKTVDDSMAQADVVGIAEDYVAGIFAKQLYATPSRDALAAEIMVARQSSMGPKFARDRPNLEEAKKQIAQIRRHRAQVGQTAQELRDEAASFHDGTATVKLHPSTGTHTTFGLREIVKKATEKIGDSSPTLNAFFASWSEKQEAAALAAENFVRNSRATKWLTTNPMKHVMNENLLLDSMSVMKGQKARAQKIAADMADMSEMKELTHPKLTERKERKAFEKRKDGVREVVWQYMTTKDAEVDAMITDEMVADKMGLKLTTPGVRKAAKALREKAFDTKVRMIEAGQELVDAGILEEAQYRKYGGAYLPRLYLQHLRENPESSILFNMTNRPSSMSYRRPRNEGLSDWYRVEHLQDIKQPAFQAARSYGVEMMDAALIDWMSWLSVEGIKRGWVLPGSTQRYRGMTVTPEWLRAQAQSIDQRIREGAYGEGIEREAAEDNVKELMDLSEQGRIARGGPRGKLLEETAKAPKWTVFKKGAINPAKMEGAVEGEFGEYIQIPNTARYGPLRGLAVQRAIYDQIISPWAGGGDAGEVIQILSRLQNIWKMAKVPLNVGVSWTRNIVSGSLSQYMGGMSVQEIAVYNADALEEFKAREGPLWDIALQHGIAQSTFSEAELMQIDNSIKFYLRMIDKPTPAQKAKLVAEGTLYKVTKPLLGFYQGIEVVQKMAMIKHGMEKLGMDKFDAVRHANRNLFDYGLVGRNIEIGRRIPIGSPFMTYTYKVLPTLAYNFVKNPIRTSFSMMVLPYMLGSAALREFDDDDLDNFKDNMAQWVREKMENHMLSWGPIGIGLPPTMMVLPGKDDDGNLDLFDYGYYMPPGAFIDIAKWGVHAGQAVFGDKRMERGLTEPVSILGFGGAPLLSAYAQTLLGVDPFTGREIYDPDLPPDEKIQAIVTAFVNFIVPSFLSTYGGLGRFVTQDLLGVHDPRGGPKYTTGHMLARSVGANVRPVSEEIELMNRALDAQISERKAGTRMGKALRSGRETGDEVMDQLDATLYKLDRLSRGATGLGELGRKGLGFRIPGRN